MHSLTKSQEKVLRFINDFTRENGMPPSFSEIGSALGGIKSSTVFYYVQVLTKKGFLRQGSSRARDLRLASPVTAAGLTGVGTRGCHVLGQVPAGKPALAQEEIEDTLWLDERICKSKDAYLLRVKGDSMIGAGIFDKDLVIVRPQKEADPGEIVVALVEDEEGTIKTLRGKGPHAYLEAANPHYEPIRKEFQIVGKVIGMIRKQITHVN